MGKRIYKYGTGDKIPEGAEYLNTVTQTMVEDAHKNKWYPCWLVWHYYAVEEQDE